MNAVTEAMIQQNLGFEYQGLQGVGHTTAYQNVDLNSDISVVTVWY